MKLQLFVLAFVISFCIAQQCTDIPVAKCNSNPPAIVLPLDSNGEYQITVNDINNGSTTTCPPISLSLRNAPVNNVAICNTVDFIPPYPLTIFLLVSSAGSTQPSICVTRFEVVDQIAPKAVCKAITVGSNTVLTASMVDGGSFDNCDIKSRIINVTSVGACDQTVGVLLTVSDYSGNVDHCETTVTVVDSIAPQAKCQNSTQNVGSSGKITINSNQANLIDNGSFDNCDGTNIDLELVFSDGSSSITRDCNTLGTAIVGLDATDTAGNVGSCNANIFFKDLTAPNAVCNNLSVDVGVDYYVNINAESITGDSSDACGIASYGSDVQVDCTSINYTPNSYTGSFDGHPTVVPFSFVVSDHSENQNTCSSKVTVSDNTDPVANCVTSFTLNVGEGSGSISFSEVNDNSYDVCGYFRGSLSEDYFTCADLGKSRNVTLTILDPFNNTDSCTTFIDIVDIDAPDTVCATNTIDVGATPSGVYTVHPSDGYLIDNGSEDECTNITTTLNIARDLDINCNMLGKRDFTLIATDAYGNFGTCSSSILFVDNTPPTAVCAATAQVDIGNGVNHYFTSQFLMDGTTDVCGVTYTPVEHLFNCTQGLGSFIVTSTASDPSGNSAVCKTNVTVVDTVEPNPECKLNAKLNVGATGTANATTTVIDNGSYDACSNVTLKIINSQANFTCADIGLHDVILQVSDSSKNVATCTAPLNIVDSTPPTAVCKTYIADVGSSPGGFVALNVNDGKLSDGGSSDVCTPASDLVFTYDSPITGSCATIGSVAPTLFVTDAYGNQGSCVANVTFKDLTPPEVACATLTILNVGRGPASPILSHIATASDICGPLFYSTTNTSTYTCANIGDHNFTVFVTDGAGNQGYCTTLLRVVDNTPPAATCAPLFNLTVGTGYGLLSTSNVNAGSTDTCDSNPTLSLDKSNFTCSDVGVRTVTLTVKDISNNTDTCQSVINVVDSTKPSPSCKNIVVNVGDDGSQTLTTADGNLVDNGSSDICSPVSLTLNKSYTGTCGTLGLQTATLIVTDASGNNATCTSNIKFADLTPPSITCRAMVTIDVGNNSVAFNAQDGALTYFDTCMDDNGVTFSANQTTFTCANIGNTKLNVTITDGSGNIDYCVTTVIGEDHVGPVAKCNLLVPIEVGSGSATITNSTIDNSSVDLCGGTLTRSLNQTLFTCAQAGSIFPVKLSLADQYGNPSSCVGTVKLTDTVPPTAACKDITVYLDSTGNVVISPSALNNGSYDCSGALSFSASKTAFKCADKGKNTVTLTVTDLHANTATCQSTVTVVDNIIPSAKCKDVIATGTYTPIAANLDNGSSDNCGVISTIPITTLSSIGGVLTLFATDPSGNVDTCTSQITIQFGALLVVKSGSVATTQLAEHIPFEISWIADKNVPAGTLVTLGLINSKNSFFYTIAENVQFDRLRYVVSNGITDVTADQDYLIVMYVPGKTDYASVGITLIRYPTNHP